MTYLDSELSQHDGKPIELYKFEGTYENYYYTSAARKITYLGNDYLPIPLQRTEIAAGTQNDDGLNITIDLPVTAGLIAIYGFEDSPPELNLTIYRYHEVGAVVPYWVGPVASITTNDGIGTVQSNSELATLLASDFPNVYYQGPCNFTLFDQRCKVIEDHYSGTAVLGVVNGRTISIDAIPMGGDIPVVPATIPPTHTNINLDGKLIGGEVKLPSGERRMIVGQAGVVLTLNFPFSRTTIGDVVTITAGCDHAYTGDCKVKFNNQKNYGGFPFIGADNPFTAGIQDGSELPDNTCLPARFEGWYYRLYFTVTDNCRDDPPTRLGYGPEWNLGSGMYNGSTARDGTGKLIAKVFTTSNQNYYVEVYVPHVPGHFGIESQWPAFLCGSVGKDHATGNFQILYWNNPVPQFITEVTWAGLYPYNFDFDA